MVIALQVKLVLVEPEGRINMGFILRLARNFGVRDLCVVRPKFDIRDPEVLNFAARGSELVNYVNVVDSLDECLRGSGLIVCTTAVYNEESDPLRQSITLSYLSTIARQLSELTLVFGRESVGLTRNELSKCDLIMTIDVNSDYNVLNLSHAVAIVLYELLKAVGGNLIYGELVSREYISYILRYVRGIAGAVGMNPEDAEVTLRHVLSKSMLTKVEGRILYKLFKDIYHTLRSCIGFNHDPTAVEEARVQGNNSTRLVIRKS